VSADHYAGAARRWAEGASIVYGPIAEQLIAAAPHSLVGRSVLDAGAGTGVASNALLRTGARPTAADLSFDMLSWQSRARPPAAVADIRALPFRDAAFDDVVAAFVLNHLVDPASGLSELMRVTRPGGALLAAVYANASRSAVRDVLDAAARREGWQIPCWYSEIKRTAVPLLGTAEDMQRAAKAVGLVEIAVTERPVDVGVTEAEQLVDYRLGQANYAEWLGQLETEQAATIRDRLVEEIRPIMRPYLPIVVFLAALVP
jgi:ubiquinone/menaquinone biosynthesis C-methylase UbiE